MAQSVRKTPGNLARYNPGKYLDVEFASTHRTLPELPSLDTVFQPYRNMVTIFDMHSRFIATASLLAQYGPFAFTQAKVAPKQVLVAEALDEPNPALYTLVAFESSRDWTWNEETREGQYQEGNFIQLYEAKGPVERSPQAAILADKDSTAWWRSPISDELAACFGLETVRHSKVKERLDKYKAEVMEDMKRTWMLSSFAQVEMVPLSNDPNAPVANMRVPVHPEGDSSDSWARNVLPVVVVAVSAAVVATTAVVSFINKWR